MKNEATVFVYFKNNKIKVLDLEMSKNEHQTLLNDGWKHTTTLDVCRFIEHLYNNCEDVDIITDIKELTISD